MRRRQIWVVALMALLSGCSTTASRKVGQGEKGEPETVMVVYHVKAGKEQEMRAALDKVWEIYRRERLVLAQPHVIVRDTEDGGKPRFVEIFTWVNHAAPETVPDGVKKLWDEMQAICEARGEHNNLEGGEVELVTK